VALSLAATGGGDRWWISIPFIQRPDPLEESYRLVHRFYVKPVQADLISQAGLDTLTKFDHDVVVEVTDRELLIKHGTQQVTELPAPAPDDWPAWARVAGQAITSAAAVSPRIAKVPEDDLEDAVISGTVAALDPYSQYLPPNSASRNILRESERTAVDSNDGQARTNGIGTNLPVEQIPLPASVSLRIDDSIAVIQIRRFTTITGHLVNQALERAFRGQAKAPGIVLDLRGDPGGMIDAAVQVADVFLDRGRVVVLEGRDPRDRRVFKAKSDGSIYERIPLVVLVDGGSASAAEVVAAALQDNRRALVIGTSTFGKGTSQRIIELANGGELWLTSAYMRSASGYLLDRHGVIPNICTAEQADSARAERFHSLVAKKRTSLSEAEWAELRRGCPPSELQAADALERAKRVLHSRADRPL
jgi:carboxyl-terminal processing protease